METFNNQLVGGESSYDKYHTILVGGARHVRAYVVQ